MSGIPFSPADAAWLGLETPTNPMVTTILAILDAPVDYERLKATLERRLLCYDRFRQRVVQLRSPWAMPYWEDDPKFDLDAHLRRVTLPPPGDAAALVDLLSELVSTRLDFSLPLWQLQLVEHYGDGCVVILRIHHCIADGTALARLALALADTDPRAPWPAAAPRRSRRRSWYPPGPLSRTAVYALRTATQVTGTLLHEGRETLAHPSHALDLARLGIGGALAAGRVILLEPAPPTPFKGELGSTKRVAISAPIALKDIKDIGHASDSKVNDVMLAALAGAFRRYIQERGHPTEGLSFTAVVPVNLRSAGTGPQLGNRFGLTFVSLPVGVADPFERLDAIRQHTAEIKESPEAIVAFGVLNVMGAAPPGISEFVAGFFGGKATAVITNVAAPKERLYLAGAPISTAMGFVPHAVNVGVGVSIVSYAGQIRVGIVTDQGLVPDPQAIMAAFYTELDELRRLPGQTDATPGEATGPMMAMLDNAIRALNGILNDAAET